MYSFGSSSDRLARARWRVACFRIQERDRHPFGYYIEHGNPIVGTCACDAARYQRFKNSGVRGRAGGNVKD